MGEILLVPLSLQPPGASGKADAHLELGNIDRLLLWVRISQAIEELQRTAFEIDENVH